MLNFSILYSNFVGNCSSIKFLSLLLEVSSTKQIFLLVLSVSKFYIEIEYLIAQDFPKVDNFMFKCDIFESSDSYIFISKFSKFA